MDKFSSLKSRMKAQYEEQMSKVQAKLKAEDESDSGDEEENVSPPRKASTAVKNGSFIGGASTDPAPAQAAASGTAAGEQPSGPTPPRQVLKFNINNMDQFTHEELQRVILKYDQAHATQR